MKTEIIKISIIVLSLFFTPTFAMMDYYMTAILPSIIAQQQLPNNKKVTMEDITDVDARWMRVYTGYDENRGYECYRFAQLEFYKYIAKSYSDDNAWDTKPSPLGFHLNEYEENLAVFDEGVDIGDSLTIYVDFDASSQDRLVTNYYNWDTGSYEEVGVIWKKVDDCVNKIKPYRDVPTCSGQLPNLTRSQSNPSTSNTPKWDEIVIPGTYITGSDLHSVNFVFDTVGLILESGFDPASFAGSFLSTFGLPLFGGDEKIVDPYEKTFQQINMKLDAIITGINQVGVVTTDTNSIVTNLADTIDENKLNDYVSWFTELDTVSTTIREKFLQNVSEGGCDMIDFSQINISRCNALKENIFGTQMKYPDHNGGDKPFLEAIKYYRENLVHNDGMFAKLAAMKRQELAYNLPKVGTFRRPADYPSIKEYFDAYNDWVIGHSLKIATYLDLFFQYDLMALYLGSDVSSCNATFDKQPFFTGYTPQHDLTGYENNVQTLAKLYFALGGDLKELTNSLIISDAINGIDRMDQNLSTTWISAANNELPRATSQTVPNFPLGTWRQNCTLYQYDKFDNITPPANGYASTYYYGVGIGDMECNGFMNEGSFDFSDHCNNNSLIVYEGGVLGCEKDQYKHTSYWDRGYFYTASLGLATNKFSWGVNAGTAVDCQYHNPLGLYDSEICFGVGGLTTPLAQYNMYLYNSSNVQYQYGEVSVTQVGGTNIPFWTDNPSTSAPRIVYKSLTQNSSEWGVFKLIRANQPANLFYIYGHKVDYQSNGYDDYTSWFNITVGCAGTANCVDDKNPYGNTICVNGQTKMSIKDGKFYVDFDTNCLE